jgi:septum formation protein
MPELPYVILASASPRRRELVQLLDVQFEVRPSGVGEEQQPWESPIDFVTRLAREKAEDVARSLAPFPANTVVLGADTEVTLDPHSPEAVAFGKPETDTHAAEMLRRLAGRPHEVISAIHLCRGNSPALSEVISTRVWFSEMSDAEIADYVASGEARGKAGAYAIQGRAARFIPRIEGCYYNVMGLPVAALYELLRRAF